MLISIIYLLRVQFSAVRYMTQQQLQCCGALHYTKHHLNVRSCSQISPFLAHAHFDPILQFHSVIWPRVEYSFIITAAVLLQSESQGKAMHYCGCGFKLQISKYGFDLFQHITALVNGHVYVSTFSLHQ